MLALLIALTVAAATPAAAPADKPVTGPHYAESYAWCAEQFKGRPDLVEACAWGAYVTAPDARDTTEWSA